MLNRRRLLKSGSVLTAGLVGISILPSANAMQEDGPGSIRWSFTPGEIGFTSPQLQDDTLYASSNTAAYALDAHSGDEQWHVNLERWLNAGQKETSRVSAFGDSTIYTTTASRYYATLRAIDISSGDERWVIESDSESYFSPIEVDGTVFVGQEGYAFCALDPMTQEEYWRTTLSGGVVYPPLFHEGTLYAGCFGGNLYAIDSSNGTELWRFSTGSRLLSPEAVVDGVVYTGGDEGDHGIIIALDALTGDEIWRAACQALISGQPSIANGTVYAKDLDFSTYAFDAATGSERWRFPIAGQVFRSQPAEIDGRVFLSSYDGNLYALEANSGIELWRYEVDGSVNALPVVVDGTVYISDNQTTNLYAVDAEDGIERWRVELNGSVTYAPVPVGDTICVCDGFGVHAVVGETPHLPSPEVGGKAITLVETPLRAAPLATADVVETLDEGTEVDITGEPAETGGITWWPVRTQDEKTGWVDDDALARA